MLNTLKKSKNLLAFSAGIDSTALFFILLEKNIPFDIALVNYNTRTQAKEEVKYAKKLALKYNKKCFIKNVYIKDSNFEKNARDIRYSFFEELIYKYSYSSLLTAHQLDDSFEWFLMQLSKGAGLSELLGFQASSSRKNYTLYKPLLHKSKQELKSFLDKNKIKYFIDNSNFDTKFTRNKMRHNFSNKFLKEYKNGVLKSFEYLNNDLNSLNINMQYIFKAKELELFKTNEDDNLNIRVIDRNLKKRGFLISKKQRDEIIKQRQLVISNKISICIKKTYIWICPYETNFMNKIFKEKCRILKIPSNIRAYIYKEDILDKLEILNQKTILINKDENS